MPDLCQVSTMRIPIYKDGQEKPVGYQIRNNGQVKNPPGIEISECLPHIGRILDSGVVLVCEGPTDVNAAMVCRELDGYSILGAWSSTSTPGRNFWHSRFSAGKHALVVCGDNDPSGSSFNQRIANEWGHPVYPIRWPAVRPLKWDVKDQIVTGIPAVLTTLISLALHSEPLKPEPVKAKRDRAYTSAPVLISTLIEEAGGRLAYEMGHNAKYFCPLHEDREDASLTANDETGGWKCWACGISGGPAQWLMHWKGLSYQDAIELMRKYQ